MKILLLVNVRSLENRSRQLKYYDKKNGKSKDYYTTDLLQTTIDYAYKLRVQDFAAGKNFSFN